MSRSNPTPSNNSNPSVATIEWAATKNTFMAWDSVNKERVDIGKKVSFAILDFRSAVSGFIKGRGVARCHEMKDLRKPIDVLLWKDGKSTPFMNGIYRDIKPELTSAGVKYRKIVYAMLTEDAGSIPAHSIVKFDLGGAAMGAFIECDFRETDSVTVKEPLFVELNSMIKFYVPVFEKLELDDEFAAAAEMADRELQEYFDSFTDTAPKVEVNEQELEEPLPF